MTCGICIIKKTRNPLCLYLTVAVWLALGCAHRPAATDTISEFRNVESFDRLAVSGAMAIRVRIGSGPNVYLRGRNDLVTATEVRVEDGLLRIRAPKIVLEEDRISVEVVTPRLTRIHAATSENISIDFQNAALDDIDIVMTGVGKLAATHLAARRITAAISGTGTLDLQGTADHFDFKLAGMGQGNFENLCLDTADVRVHGMGKITVNASDALDAIVKGFGRVNYIGTPRLSPMLRGGGSIRAIDVDRNVCLAV